MYTDGLTEARHGRLFGLDTVSAPLGGLRRPSPTEAIAILRARVAEFAYGALTDDLCMFAARIDWWISAVQRRENSGFPDLIQGYGGAWTPPIRRHN